MVRTVLGPMVVLALAPVAATAEQPAAVAREQAPRLWSLGVRGGYTTVPNFVLGGFFEKYQPIDGFFVEAVAGRRIKGFTLYGTFAVSHYTAPRGVWQRNQFKTPEQVDIAATFLSADALFDWEVRLHRAFAFHFGAGIGIGAIFGTIRSQKCQLTTIGGVTTCNPFAPPVDQIAESAWPIFPVLHLVAGARIDLPHRVSLRVDFDFRNAFGVGLGVFYEL